MTKRVILIISVVLAFLFITNVTFAQNTARNAANTVSQGVHNAGSRVGGAVRGTMDHVEDGMQRDGTHQRGIHHVRSETNPTAANRNNYMATRTSVPFTDNHRTNQIITWSVLAVVGLVIIATVWYYTANTTRTRRDLD